MATPIPIFLPTLSAACRDGHAAGRGLLLQWHITERCNLHCAHCYQESDGCQELPLSTLLTILNQYKTLLAARRNHTGRPVRGHITLTGGEPFVRDDLWELLEMFYAQQSLYSFAVLTNGTLINRAVARRLRRLRPAFVQVSIEGTPATHDAIRGAGSYQRAVTGIEELTAVGIRTLISFTASRLNYREFPDVARLARRLRVSRLWADRLIPCGDGAALRAQLLTPDETREFFALMRAARDERTGGWLRRRLQWHTEIAMHRALQFLVGGGAPYRCTAGDKLLTVQPNGDVYPCRRLPIRVGNVLETPLVELHRESPLLQELRAGARQPEGCQGCVYARTCRGGLRCLAHAVNGDAFTKDPGCWLAPRATLAVTGTAARSSWVT